ncbi:MAG: hypothetical protein JW991_01505 [Candidatus Pacebacteria bacterium]|nr:hypothetical protein [Candidatus Paceibacterota bacterium]
MSSPRKIKLGYSCWGFLGKGVVDTPDGGRSHRLVLLKELIKRNFSIYMLQKNRDLIEAGDDFSSSYLSFREDLPDIDALFLEYRWPIPGRNCQVDKKSTEYTPDLDRQNELLKHYQTQRIPILIWDKDQKLEKKIFPGNVVIFEAALKPRPGRVKLLFPVDDDKVQKAIRSLDRYSKENKKNKLVYIGNRYERDETFKKYYIDSTKLLNSTVFIYGKWKNFPDKCKNLNFMGRIGYNKVCSVYLNSFLTILIAPDRYYQSGQYTQRLFESLWGLCLPLVPEEYYQKEKIILPELVVGSSENIVKKINWLTSLVNQEIKSILKKQLEMLKIFSVEKQVEVIIKQLKKVKDANGRIS